MTELMSNFYLSCRSEQTLQSEAEAGGDKPRHFAETEMQTAVQW